MDSREAEELCWCPSWSNSLWQEWSCGLVYCPGGNATDLISKVLASSDGISSWTSLNLLYHSKTDARFMQDAPKAVWSIPYVSVAFFLNLKQNLFHIVLLKCQTAFLKFTSCDNQALVECILIPAVAVHSNLKS